MLCAPVGFLRSDGDSSAQFIDRCASGRLSRIAVVQFANQGQPDGLALRSLFNGTWDRTIAIHRSGGSMAVVTKKNTATGWVGLGVIPPTWRISQSNSSQS
jgi:hypothetical protein